MISHQEGLSTSRDYAREAEHTRRRLAENLDELSDRLTPGQVFDEMLTYSRAGGGTFLSTFSNTMRQNPLPSLLIGAGCMMFLSEKMGMRPGFGNGSHQSTSTADEPYGVASGRSAVSDAAGRMSNTVGKVTRPAASSAHAAAASVSSSLASASEATRRRAADVTSGIAETAGIASDTAASAADALRGVAHDARDSASWGVEQIRHSAQIAAGTMRDSAAAMGRAAADRASDTAASVRDTAASMGGRITDSADRTRRHAVNTVRQGRESAASFISEQPLLCAAIGVAIGAALASMLPSSEVEDRLMGETSDAVKGAAKDVAQRTGSSALESAKNAAAKVADRAQAAAAEEGLSASALADDVRSNLDEGIKKDRQGVLDDPTTGTGPRKGLLDRSD